MSKSSSSSSLKSSSSSSSCSSFSSSGSNKSFSNVYQKSKEPETKPLDVNSNLSNTESNLKNSNNTEKNLLESAYTTKNVGLLGYSFLSYIGSKAKSIFTTEEMKHSPKTSEEDLTENKIINRVSIVQCSANNPVEDRFNAIQLKNIDGYYVSVLDGHGGNQIADYANKKLHVYFDNRIKFLENSDFKLKQKIHDSFMYAFEQVVSLLYVLIFFNNYRKRTALKLPWRNIRRV
jgi:hypothetical protein